ncbi:MAG: hypothetical protein LAO79_19880 [Acidobacteriia bacterium]|nr:hypothetical protein [Terriglobia bacterium]
MTAVVIAFALLFGTVECKTSCARETCEKAPPCHGQKTVRACTDELIVDRPAVVAAAVVPPLADFAISIEPVLWAESMVASAPPVLSSPPLRI